MAKRSPIRRLERWIVGVTMGIMAFVLEKAMLRSIRRGVARPRPVVEPPTGTIKGREVEGPLGG
ncbi:MAG TPA: hypothetical protein VFT27_06245 [Actinomycetota bacterium]|nr:hypothetical protein [Actinomycetota bacterium]